MSHARTCGNCGHGAERQDDGACVTCVDVNSNWTPKITQQAARDLLAALRLMLTTFAPIVVDCGHCPKSDVCDAAWVCGEIAACEAATKAIADTKGKPDA
jgi:hypothetical protein